MADGKTGKLYKCEKCPSAFGRMSELLLHTKKFHVEQEGVVIDCEVDCSFMVMSVDSDNTVDSVVSSGSW
jgi:hypothetical protein